MSITVLGKYVRPPSSLDRYPRGAQVVKLPDGMYAIVYDTDNRSVLRKQTDELMAETAQLKSKWMSDLEYIDQQRDRYQAETIRRWTNGELDPNMPESTRESYLNWYRGRVLFALNHGEELPA